MNQPKQRYKSNEIIVNNKSNFKSHLVRCQTIIDNIQFDELVLKAIGKAIPKAINLALQLNSNNFDTFQLITATKSVEKFEDRRTKPIRGANKDSFDPDDKSTPRRRTAQVPAIEITVRKNQLELKKIQLTRKQTKDTGSDRRPDQTKDLPTKSLATRLEG